MKELNDNEIRVIGANKEDSPQSAPRYGKVIIASVICAVAIAAALWIWRSHVVHSRETAFFDSTTVESVTPPSIKAADMRPDTIVGITMRDTMVNDIPMTIFTPHNLHARLHVGPLSFEYADTSIVLALQAADIRADNFKIVSAFVLKGETLSKGSSKLGYCAIIDDMVSIGVDEVTALYEKTIEKNGDFFRQYPLVKKGCIVENKIKNKAVRRALAEIDGRVTVVVTSSRESLHDFAQALVDIGATTAINLVGGNLISGWVIAEDSLVVHEQPLLSGPIPENINFFILSK